MKFFACLFFDFRVPVASNFQCRFPISVCTSSLGMFVFSVLPRLWYSHSWFLCRCFPAFFVLFSEGCNWCFFFLESGILPAATSLRQTRGDPTMHRVYFPPETKLFVVKKAGLLSAWDRRFNHGGSRDGAADCVCRFLVLMFAATGSVLGESSRIRVQR